MLDNGNCTSNITLNDAGFVLSGFVQTELDAPAQQLFGHTCVSKESSLRWHCILIPLFKFVSVLGELSVQLSIVAELLDNSYIRQSAEFWASALERRMGSRFVCIITWWRSRILQPILALALQPRLL